MKEYQEPIVEVIELPEEDIITTSGGGPKGTGGDTETESGSIGPFGMTNGSFGGGANWQ